jgi:hypothetical protein
MHIKGSCHIAAECRLREKELSMQQEISKRLAISSVPSISLHMSSNVLKEKELYFFFI